MMDAWKRQNALFIALLIGIFMMIGLLAVRYDYAWDLTFNQRNQLSQTSIDIVKKLDAPLHITAFTRGNPKIKFLINRLLSRYKTHADVDWAFKNPDSEIDTVREYGISRDGDMLLTYRDKTVRVDTVSETAITRGIYQLLARRVRNVLFTVGHGEIGFDKTLDSFNQLKARLLLEAITVNPIDLSRVKQVPDDTDVLVIAAPQFAIGDVEAKAIHDYIQRGGRVLWLAGQANPAAQPALSDVIGARFMRGKLFGRGGKAYGLEDSSYVPIVPNPKQPTEALAGIETLLVFPEASPIEILPTEQASQWTARALLQPSGDWFLRDGSQVLKAPAPVLIGISLSAVNPDTHGKWWLIGDADFATDRFIGQGQNGDFAVNILRYLASPDVGFINIDNAMPPPVVMSKDALANLALLLVLGVPISILTLGFFVRRRLLR